MLYRVDGWRYQSYLIDELWWNWDKIDLILFFFVFFDISKGGKIPIEGYEEFNKQVNAKYDAELEQLNQQTNQEAPQGQTS